MAKRNAEIVLKYTTAYPFRQRGKFMVCVYCCEEYDDPSEYRLHMENLHQRFTVSTAFAHCGHRKEFLKVDCTELRCRLCNEELNNLKDAAQHAYKVHNCYKLNMKYDVAMQPYRISKDNWACYMCDKKFASLTRLARHTTSHYQSYTCDVCGRSYLTNEALKYHVRCSHSGKLQCRKCWNEFESIEKKREHLKVSKPCWSFCCVQCGDRFMSYEMKQKHMVDEHNAPKPTYECPDCPTVYESRKLFYNHYKLVHSDESFVCSVCGLKFMSKTNLEDHRLGHSGEKHFKCEVCLKSFSREKSLKQHMWLHSETKRFSCEICDKQFNQKVSLKGHMKSHHPNVTLDTIMIL